MSSSKTLDLTYISENDNKRAEIYANFGDNIEFEKIKSVSISKMDLTFNNTLPSYIVPIISPYNEELDITKGFKTPYKIYLSYNSEYDVNYNEFKRFNEIKTKEINIYWLNNSLNINNVSFNGEDYDNNNNYFKVFSFKRFMEVINEHINNLWVECLKIDDKSKLLTPAFDVINDVLYYYSTYDTEDNIYNNVSKYSNIKNDGTMTVEYCFGFNEDFARDFLRGFNIVKENNIYYIDNIPLYVNTNNLELVFNYNKSYYDEGDTPELQPEVQYKEMYYIYSINDPSFYEYTSYIQAIVLESINLPTEPMYMNANINTTYKLINNSNEINNNFKGLIKTNINHVSEKLNRLIYSNSSILDNTIKLKNNSNIQTMDIRIYYIDKYLNLFPLYLNKYDTINISITFNF
jgi:hypothetical protein